jgi:hypothetical protein
MKRPPDRSFVLDMTAGPEGLALVSTIINLAHALKSNEVQGGGRGCRNRGVIVPAPVAGLRRNAGLFMQQTGGERDLRILIPVPACRRVTNSDAYPDRGQLKNPHDVMTGVPPDHAAVPGSSRNSTRRRTAIFRK